MPDQWTERLSAYLDDEMVADERRGLERHLDECASCRSDVERLARVKDWAATYTGVQPSPTVWKAVRERVRREQKHAATPLSVGRRARIATRLPLALAASLALVVVGVGGWLVGRTTAPGSVAAAGEPTSGSVGGVTVAARQTDAALLAAEKYGAAIAQLERVLLREGSQLDSATVRVVAEKLVVIDRAIAEARAAMARDPASQYLAEHFATMMRKKLNLLRSAAAVQRS